MMSATRTKAVGQWVLIALCPLTVLCRVANHTDWHEAVLIHHRSPHTQGATYTRATSLLRIADTVTDLDRRHVSSVLDSATSQRCFLPIQRRPASAFAALSVSVP